VTVPRARGIVRENLLYILVSVGLGGVMGFALCAPVFEGGALLEPDWLLHPSQAGPVFVAVVSSAWLLRPCIELPGMWALGSGTFLAYLSAAQCAFWLVLIDRMVWDLSLAGALLDALGAMALAVMLCTFFGFVTLPMGACFALVLRGALRAQRRRRGQADSGPTSR